MAVVTARLTKTPYLKAPLWFFVSMLWQGKVQFSTSTTLTATKTKICMVTRAHGISATALLGKFIDFGKYHACPDNFTLTLFNKSK